MSDVVVVNRLSEDLKDVKDTIFTRDIFNSDSDMSTLYHTQNKYI